METVQKSGYINLKICWNKWGARFNRILPPFLIRSHTLIRSKVWPKLSLRLRKNRNFRDPPPTPTRSILKRSSSENDIVNIAYSKVLQSDKGAGPEKLAPPSVPYLGYSMLYMYPYPPLPVPPPPPTPLKKKKIEAKTVVEKDLVTINTMIDDIQKDAGECVKTAILEENWEENHKLLLEKFIRQEEENKYNLEGQEEQILDSFLSSKKCKIKNPKKPVNLPPPPQEKAEAADQPFFTIFSLLLTLIVHNVLTYR